MEYTEIDKRNSLIMFTCALNKKQIHPGDERKRLQGHINESMPVFWQNEQHSRMYNPESHPVTW